ncbi:hypothetical protein SNE40_009828 [Patella caerulea]
MLCFFLWAHERSGGWWNYIVCNTFNEEQWIENFRMRQDTFNMICDALRPYIKRKDTSFRRCIPVEKRVAISLWTLATPCEYRTISHLFGISRSSICLILKEFCKIINKRLSKRYIYLPEGDELYDIMLNFEQKWGFPNCVGATDGCHIPIIAPKHDQTDYYNRKGWYSILLQAVVDSNYLFRDTCIGWPGRVHDARVLANSKLYNMGQEGKLFANHSRNISGVQVPAVILGDPVYPLLQWLMKPYAESANMTAEQKKK